MKILALDLGERTLGIAISDPTQTLARGIENFRFENDDEAAPLNRVLKILEEEPVEKIVLGHPKNMDGSAGPQAKKSETFKERLEEKTDVDVILYDERLTTRMASKTMIMSKKNRKSRKRTIDQTAATLLLQNYLDSKKGA